MKMKVAVYILTKKKGSTSFEEFENRKFLNNGKGQYKDQYQKQRNQEKYAWWRVRYDVFHRKGRVFSL